MTVDLRGLRILVVEDDGDLREIYIEDFEECGATVTAVAGGHEALDKAQSTEFDLVFTDVRMRHGDGIELVEKIRTLCAHQPAVVFCSGYCDVAADFIQKWGVAKRFDKPYERAELLEWIQAQFPPSLRPARRD